MNTDSLGGGRVTTGDVDATNTSSTFKTSNTTIEATEGRVSFGTANMGTATRHMLLPTQVEHGQLQQMQLTAAHCSRLTQLQVL